MGKLACYCKMGIMAQCVAVNTDEQMACHFSVKSSNGFRCMHLNAKLDNHCWNTKAHDYSNEHGVVRLEDVEFDEPEIIYDASKEQELKEPRYNCRDCMSYTSCSKLINLATAATAHGGITEQDLWNQASACGSYIEETKIDLSGGI